MPVYGGLIITHQTLLTWGNILEEEEPYVPREGCRRHPLWFLKRARSDVSRGANVRLIRLPCPPNTPSDMFLYVIACGKSPYQGFTNKSFAELGYDQSKVPYKVIPSEHVAAVQEVLDRRGLKHEGYQSVFVANFTATK
ncbi:hypothetical protein BT69DRAFT_1286525 [Atractiella rhizophila]|nr:hypothetical protein BT69DRAFT_1286525 [Atractiella rhizophila]